ncbi:MAG: hypothetical protein ACJ8H8_06520, partial [Geminicoccaceae bacterium]
MSSAQTPATDAASIKATVREKYGEAAKRVLQTAAAPSCGPASSCCGGAPGNGQRDPITADLY